MPEQNTIPLDASGTVKAMTIPDTAFSKATLTIEYESPVLHNEKQHVFEVNRACPVLKENANTTLPSATLLNKGTPERITMSESRRSTTLRSIYFAVCSSCPFFTDTDAAAGCRGFRTPKDK